MSDTQNPYAPPSESNLQSFAPSITGAYRDNKLLVLTRDFESPPYCIVSGAPIPDGQKTHQKQLTYAHPAYLLLLLLGLLPAIIIILIVQQKLNTKIYYEKKLKRKKTLIATVGITCFLASLALFIAAATTESALLGFTALALLICWIILAIMSAFLPDIKVKRAKNKIFFVKGAHPDFLALFPPMPPDIFPVK